MLLSDRPDHRLLQAIQAQGEERTWRAVNTIFDLAGQATALDPAELLNRLGFESNDLDSANFQAMLAVLRTINKLHETGFMEIAPLRPRLVRREADLLAIKTVGAMRLKYFAPVKRPTGSQTMNLDQLI